MSRREKINRILLNHFGWQLKISRDKAVNKIMAISLDIPNYKEAEDKYGNYDDDYQHGFLACHEWMYNEVIKRNNE